MNRRNFLKKTAATGASALFLSEIVNAAMPVFATAGVAQPYPLSKGGIVLFQGDSITDAGRNYNDEAVPDSPSALGMGYPLFTAASLLANHPEKELNLYNRGISGNKVFQLAERWEKDCLELHPDILSILIGVNDFWHTKTGGYAGTIETYATDYQNLILQTKKALPEIKIIILEPFIIHGGTALDDTWENDFAPYRTAAEKVATDNDLIFVPLQSVFNEALKQAPSDYWGKDGVHPSMAGAQLMAQAWLKAVL
ncbi:MAG: GDSL-type esterase/lipase family protein [Candidatus Azobacteroides sp.]|nr:GDSL-type esterase/lipase family protein [Candidatus Azobacteroides sp.]